MMNNITIGQYIPGNSIIHRLDPRTKLISMLVLIVLVFLVPVRLEAFYLITLGALFLLTILLVLLAQVPLLKVLRGLKGIVVLLTITFLLQLFTFRTGSILFETPMGVSILNIGIMILIVIVYMITKKYIKFKIIYFMLMVVSLFVVQALVPQYAFHNYNFLISVDGLSRAIFIFARIVTVMIIASLLTFTTSVIELNDGLESLLTPFKLIGLQTGVFSMMIALTLRSIPTLLGETEKILKAQMSRGVDFKENKLKDKILQIISLLIPVFVISFNRAEDLANAMEVRGYVIGEKRTKIDIYQFSFKDVMALIIIFGILATYLTLWLGGYAV